MFDKVDLKQVCLKPPWQVGMLLWNPQNETTTLNEMFSKPGRDLIGRYQEHLCGSKNSFCKAWTFLVLVDFLSGPVVGSEQSSRRLGGGARGNRRDRGIRSDVCQGGGRIRVRGWGAHLPCEGCLWDTGEAGWSCLCSDFSGFPLTRMTLKRRKRWISGAAQSQHSSQDFAQIETHIRSAAYSRLRRLHHKKSLRHDDLWDLLFSSWDRCQWIYLGGEQWNSHAEKQSGEESLHTTVIPPYQ